MSARILLLGLMIAATSQALADSSCWPEEELVGTTSIGYVGGFNYLLGKWTGDTYEFAGKECTVELFDSADAKSGSMRPCSELPCIRGECGGAGEHTMLPIDGHSGAFVQVRMKNDKPAWLRLPKDATVTPILAVGTTGTLFPESATLLDSKKNGKPLESKPDMAYTVLELTTEGQEQWAKVALKEIRSGTLPVEVGESLGVAYFRYKNSEGVVEAALSAIYCD